MRRHQYPVCLEENNRTAKCFVILRENDSHFQQGTVASEHERSDAQAFTGMYGRLHFG
jgi:hypothetical protein